VNDRDLPPTGDPFRFTTIAHAGRAILGPLDDADLDRIVADLPAGPQALDIGCGKGELLVRLALRGARGAGVDHNPWYLAAARARAAAAGVDGRIHWHTVDARTDPPAGPVDLVACIGASDAVGGPPRAPDALAGMVRPGGTIVLGELFWSVVPDAALVTGFGIHPGDIVTEAETLDRMTAAGLEVVAVHAASSAAWERYEAEYAAAVTAWAEAHPHDPDHDPFLHRAAIMRGSWDVWRRASMGFLTVVLRRPSS
jgi:cyclopropane fatty-acyl-phospholipid synthase-like methyltransferase